MTEAIVRAGVVQWTCALLVCPICCIVSKRGCKHTDKAAQTYMVMLARWAGGAEERRKVAPADQMAGRYAWTPGTL